MQQLAVAEVDSPRTHQIHKFGSVYSPDARKQVFFSQQSPSNPNPDLHSIHRENIQLKQQLREVRKILSEVLHSEGEEEDKTTMELLQQLLLLVLSKAEENAVLKQMLEQIKQQFMQSTDSKESFYHSSKPESKVSSSYLHTPLQESQVNSFIPQHSPVMSEAVSKYWPKVLFSIGKEVKTISQLSTNKLLKKESQYSYSKSSSQENSFKELLHLRQDRLSIDKSIYVADDNFRYSLKDSSRESLQQITGKNIGNVTPISTQLTPIKEERFSDIYSEINTSKIKPSVHFACERFTFESTNTEPENFYNNKK